MFAHASFADFDSVSVSMAGMVSCCFETLGQTKLVEDCFHCERQHETRTQDNKTMSAQRVFEVCLNSNVLDRVHHFDSVVSSDFRGPLSSSAVPRSLFCPDVQGKLSVPAEKVATRRTWISHSPQSSTCLGSDLALIRECHRAGTWSSAPSHWLCLLVPEGTIFKQPHDTTWYLSLGAVQGVAVLSWPCERVRLSLTDSGFRPTKDCTIQQLHWSVVLDPSIVDVHPVQVVSPLWVAASRQGKPMDHPELCLRTCGPHLKLLEHAAREAFYTLPLAFLTRLAKHLLLEVAKGVTLPSILRQLVLAILPTTTEKQLLGIFQKRLPKYSAEVQYLKVLEKQGMVEPDESDEVEKLIANDDTTDVMVAAVKGLVAKLMPSTPSSSSTAGPPKKKAKVAVKRFTPSVDPTLEEARSYLPAVAGCRIAKDIANNRWLGYYAGTSCSRSWVMRSSPSSLQEVLQFAWTEHAKCTGVACDVEDLFAPSE
jgi:hypothetical protein